MFKFQFVMVALCLSLAACGAKSRNQALPTPSDDEPELGQTTIKGEKIDTADLGKITRSSGEGCETSTSANNMILDKRIIVGTIFTEVKDEISNGVKVKYTDIHKINAVTATQEDVEEILSLGKSPVTTKGKCLVNKNTSPKLDCDLPNEDEKDVTLDQVVDSEKNPQGRGDCKLKGGFEAPDSVEGWNVKFPLKTGSSVLNGQAIVSRFKTTLNCDGKDIEGTKLLVKTYSPEIPSYNKTSCGFALVRSMVEYRDSKNKLLQRKLKKVTDVTGLGN